MHRRAGYSVTSTLMFLFVLCTILDSCHCLPIELSPQDNNNNNNSNNYKANSATEETLQCDNCSVQNGNTERIHLIDDDNLNNVNNNNNNDDNNEDDNDDGPDEEEDDYGEEGDHFEGDIILDDEYALNITNFDEDSEEFKNLVLRESRTWPSKVVFYDFSSEFNSTQRLRVELAIADIHNVSCVRFVPRTDQKTYLYFRNKKKACAAPVGWKPDRGRIDVSLGGRKCLSRLGTVQHELLHALGFWHEHSRTDRDQNILIQWDNIVSGREKNFKVRMANETTTMGIPYDFHSVMHYRNNSFSKDKKRKPTIIPKNISTSVVMGQRIRISISDIAKLNRLYRCDRNIYEMGNSIPGAIHWDLFRELFLNENPVYFNKLPEPEPLEFEENKDLYRGINETIIK